MRHAEATSFNSFTAPFRRADLLSIMLPAKSSYVCVVAAAFSRAAHFNIVVHAETTSFNSCITPFRRTDLLPSVCLTKSSFSSVVATTFSIAGHFNDVYPTNTSSAAIVVPGAPILCADPVRAMLGANKFAKDLGGLAAWSSAG